MRTQMWKKSKQNVLIMPILQNFCEFTEVYFKTQLLTEISLGHNSSV